jgi:hypothetical protein
MALPIPREAPVTIATGASTNFPDCAATEAASLVAATCAEHTPRLLSSTPTALAFFFTPTACPNPSRNPANDDPLALPILDTCKERAPAQAVVDAAATAQVDAAAMAKPKTQIPNPKAHRRRRERKKAIHHLLLFTCEWANEHGECNTSSRSMGSRERENGVSSSDTNEGEGGQSNEGGPLFQSSHFRSSTPTLQFYTDYPNYIHKLMCVSMIWSY